MKIINNIQQTDAMELDTLAKSMTDVFNLSAGDPNIDLQDAIVNSYNSIDIQDSHRYCSSQGLIELRSKLSNNPNRVIISNGAKELIYLALRAITVPMSEVVIIGPCWSSYIKICEILDLNYTLVTGSKENKFTPVIEDITSVVNRNTCAILFNNPNNPTGEVYSKSFIDKLYKLAIDNDCYIISDEIYKEFVYESNFISLRNKHNVICIDGFSKSYNLTGWRLGYAIADEDVINSMTALQSQISGPPNTLVQKIIVNCVNDLVVDKEVYKNRIECLSNFDEYFNKYKPKAGFYFYLPIGNQWISSKELAISMLKNYRIAITPGDSYGVDRTVRLSIASINIEDLEKIKYVLLVIK